MGADLPVAGGILAHSLKWVDAWSRFIFHALWQADVIPFANAHACGAGVLPLLEARPGLYRTLQGTGPAGVEILHFDRQ